MIIELTGVEAVMIKSAIKQRMQLFERSGLVENGVKDPDEKELKSILDKIDEAFKEMLKGAV